MYNAYIYDELNLAERNTIKKRSYYVSLFRSARNVQ